MQRNMRKAILVVSGLVLMAVPAMASDYSAMTTEELSQVRGTLQNVTEEERSAFRAEWQQRVSEMTPEELEQYLGKNNKRGPNMGAGSGNGKGKGKGNGRGSANTN